jgi:membrane associated rhomboid family serine protease
METCYRHPDRETGVSCSSCGRPICPGCMTPTPVGMRCPECSKERTKVRTIRTPSDEAVVTYVLIAINVLVFLGALASGGEFAGRGGGSIIDHGALCGNAVGDGGICGGNFVAGPHEYWRLFTSAFLHAGIVHIGFNMYLLYILGTLLEPAIGRLRFATLYFTSLLGGSLGALLLSSAGAETVGASGAVFGLMGGAVVTMRARGFDPMASGIPALIALNLLISVVFPGISIGGHIGGLVAGVIAAYVLVGVGDRARSAAVPILVCICLAGAEVAASIAVA